MLVLLFDSLLFGAARNIQLSLDSAVEIAMDNSYQVRRLGLEIERTRARLKVEGAGLKSRVSIRLRAPEFKAISDYKWNSTLQRDEIVRQNTRLWQMNLAIRQPVILFGFPTNGYLSLNNRIYRYLQRDGTNDLSYYNRYFLKFEQPLFQPNRLRNDIERAELDLERRELQYIEDLVDMISDIAEEYYELFRLSYQTKMYQSHVSDLEQILSIAEAKSSGSDNGNIEISQAKIELANAREQLLENKSTQRIAFTHMKKRLRLDEGDSIFIEPYTHFTPVEINVEEAINYGYTLRPKLELLNVNKKRNEIDLENAKGLNSFGVDVQMTYGLEKQD